MAFNCSYKLIFKVLIIVTILGKAKSKKFMIRLQKYIYCSFKKKRTNLIFTFYAKSQKKIEEIYVWKSCQN